MNRRSCYLKDIIVFVYFFGIFLNSDAIESGSVDISFNWKPANEYIYRSIDTQTQIISIEKQEAEFLLAFSSDSQIMFVSIDRHGNVSQSKFYLKDNDIPSKAKNDFIELMSMLQLFNLPPVPLSMNQPVDFKGIRYILDGFDKNVVRVKGMSLPDVSSFSLVSDPEESSFTLFFDVEKQTIAHLRFTGSCPYSVLELITVNPIPQNIVNDLKIKHRDSICEDDFRLMLFVPELNKGDYRDKRSAFWILCQIKDETKLQELFKTEFLTEAVNNSDPRFCQLVDNYLLTLAMSGKKWAFNELISPERNAILKETYSNSLIPLDGFGRFNDRHQLGKDPEKWKEWYTRLTNVLPSLQDTETEALETATKSNDPWVRLFALETLLQRPSVPASTTLRVLKSLADDKDPLVNSLVREQMEMFDKLTKELPSLEDAETQKLEAATQSDDPDVRLFALETLLHRPSVSESTILRVLEELSKDQDTFINGRASMLLEEMKMKKQRALLRHKQSE